MLLVESQNTNLVGKKHMFLLIFFRVKMAQHRRTNVEVLACEFVVQQRLTNDDGKKSSENDVRMLTVWTDYASVNQGGDAQHNT